MFHTRFLFIMFLLIAPGMVFISPKLSNHSVNSGIPINVKYNEDAIVGKWMSTEHNLEVQVYKEGEVFHAKIIWFKMDDTTKSMNTKTDDKNPNPSLRTRKWLGMEVLRDLKYNADEKDWEGGIIYDAKHGKEWDSVAWINSKGLLDVKGYWMFKWICKTLTFIRVV